MQKQQSMFHWVDVGHKVIIKGETRKILQNADGWVQPGTLTALSKYIGNDSSYKGFAAPFTTHFLFVANKCARQYWRTPSTPTPKLFFPLAV
jgi:hypothetical protein